MLLVTLLAKLKLLAPSSDLEPGAGVFLKASAHWTNSPCLRRCGGSKDGDLVSPNAWPAVHKANIARRMRPTHGCQDTFVCVEPMMSQQRH